LQILEDSRKQVLGLIFQNIQHISLPNSKWRFILDVLLGFCSTAQDYPYRTWFLQTLQNKIKTAICLYIKITINLIYQYNWTTSMDIWIIWSCRPRYWYYQYFTRIFQYLQYWYRYW
jgi:hypothetical protein